MHVLSHNHQVPTCIRTQVSPSPWASTVRTPFTQLLSFEVPALLIRGRWWLFAWLHCNMALAQFRKTFHKTWNEVYMREFIKNREQVTNHTNHTINYSCWPSSMYCFVWHKHQPSQTTLLAMLPCSIFTNSLWWFQILQVINIYCGRH